MNPLWGLKRDKFAVPSAEMCSQKHESSLGIETIRRQNNRSQPLWFPKA